MEKFLDTYDHPKLNQEDINHLNRSMTCNEFEASIKTLSKKRKVWDLTDSQLNSTRPLTNSFQYSFKFFHETEKEATLPNSFHEAFITLISKPDTKETSKKENYWPSSLMNIDAKMHNKIMSN
jgi:hypothetical protein